MENVNFSVDLIEAAIRHLDFLDKVSAIQTTLSGYALQHALRRYEQLWLPLADENRSYDLAAPIDIEWLWYIHMLSPLAYRRDCRKLLQNTLNHEFPPEDKFVARTNTAIELWYSTYKLDGFNTIRNGEYFRPVRNKGALKEIPSKLSTDIILNAEHHIHFCYQVALPHFRDRKYLENAVKRYKQFLLLKRQEPDEFLTPSVDIMLIWFTHMCYPKAYSKDLLDICGTVLDNNVKVRPTVLTENFLAARKKTNELWQKMGANNLLQPGSKLRSNMNTRTLLAMTLDDLINCCVVTYRVHISHAELTDMPTRVRNFQVKLFLTSVDTPEGQELLTLDGPRRMWSLSIPFHFNTEEHKSLVAQLWRKHRIWCINGDQSRVSGTANILPLLQQKDAMGKTITIEIDLQDGVTLEFDGTVQVTAPQLCSLVLHRGNFEKQTLTSKETKRILGSFSVAEESRSAEQTCFISVGRLINHTDSESFRCRVIHIPEMLCSGVQIFYGTKMVATSDVIGSSHLPTSTQVEWSELSMAFDPELGERAMLIRNHKGDWGLCVARWIQEKSFLEVRFMRLAGTKKVVRLELTSVELEFQSFTANLYTGEIFINPASNTVGENLALVFSISVLYVLCAPKKINRELSFTAPIRQSFSSQADLEKAEKEAETSKSNTVLVEEDNCQLLLAAGLDTLAPSNTYIMSKYGSLSYDLNLDAPDMIVEEQKVDKKLFRKESKELKCDIEDSPRKTPKKRKLKYRESEDNLAITDDSLKPIKPVAVEEGKRNVKPKGNQVAPMDINNDADTEQTEQKDKQKKRKRIRKKKSSTLDEMLPMSDDSITKDDIEEKRLQKDKHGKTIAVPKISNLNEELIPSDDSVDKDEKELKEFLKDVTTNKEAEETNTIELKHLSVAREETSIIRDIVEQRKTTQDVSNAGHNLSENQNLTIQDMEKTDEDDKAVAKDKYTNAMNSELNKPDNSSAENHSKFFLPEDSDNI